jgi:hypothetical protein
MSSRNTSTWRPKETRFHSGILSKIFSIYTRKQLHQQIAPLCVLFEDLRIEIAGIAAKDLGPLDETGQKGRSLYFLRRSIGTLHEFADALDQMDNSPEFVHIRARLDDDELRLWNRDITFFRKHANRVARVRHHVGGHFGAQAGQHAIENLLPDAAGSLEVKLFDDRRGGAKLHFASEIAATALIRNLRGRDSQDKIRRLLRLTVVAYRHAVRAVDCITGVCLWERFGK